MITRFLWQGMGRNLRLFVLLVLVDYIEMVRKTSGLAAASPIMVAETSLFRVPQLLEKMMPFCVLIGAMTCYLALSRRLELVVARAAGVSAWQFIAPALAAAILLGVLATVVYNPMSANLRELSKRMEAELFGGAPGGGVQDASGFWINQVNTDGSVIINAGLTVTYTPAAGKHTLTVKQTDAISGLTSALSGGVTVSVPPARSVTVMVW